MSVDNLKTFFYESHIYLECAVPRKVFFFSNSRSIFQEAHKNCALNNKRKRFAANVQYGLFTSPKSNIVCIKSIVMKIGGRM